MAESNDLDTHAKPPATIREVYKTFQKLHNSDLGDHPDILDLNRKSSLNEDRTINRTHISSLPCDLQQVFSDFLNSSQQHRAMSEGGGQVSPNPIVFEIKTVPGLYIYPALLPPEVQLSLLDKLLHRDLSNSEHKTNVHTHYHIPYPKAPSTADSVASYFDKSASDFRFTPRDSSVHARLAIDQFLNKKLRWMTLGGQYDWTQKTYPATTPPAFPSDVKKLVENVFPMKAEAAIVNIYSPGDTLSLHRDVSEECAEPLVSISLGCDGIFIAGVSASKGQAHDTGVAEDDTTVVVTRLRSGDAVLMSGQSRYSWHGIPKVVEGTCPEWMQNWPCSHDKDEQADDCGYKRWKGWVANKRINVNVRQMFD